MCFEKIISRARAFFTLPYTSRAGYKAPQNNSTPSSEIEVYQINNSTAV